MEQSLICGGLLETVVETSDLLVGFVGPGLGRRELFAQLKGLRLLAGVLFSGGDFELLDAGEGGFEFCGLLLAGQGEHFRFGLGVDGSLAGFGEFGLKATLGAAGGCDLFVERLNLGLGGGESVVGCGQFFVGGGLREGGEFGFGLGEFGLGSLTSLFGGIQLFPGGGEFVAEGGNVGRGCGQLGAEEFDFGGGVGRAVQGLGLVGLGEFGSKGGNIALANGESGLGDGEPFAKFGVGGCDWGWSRGGLFVEIDRGDGNGGGLGELSASGAELSGGEFVGQAVEFATAGAIGGGAGQPDVGLDTVVKGFVGVGVDEAKIVLGDGVSAFGLAVEGVEAFTRGLGPTGGRNSDEEESTKKRA